MPSEAEVEIALFAGQLMQGHQGPLESGYGHVGGNRRLLVPVFRKPFPVPQHGRIQSNHPGDRPDAVLRRLLNLVRLFIAHV